MADDTTRSHFWQRVVVFAIDAVLALIVGAVATMAVQRAWFANTVAELLVWTGAIIAYCLVEPATGASPAKWIAGWRVIGRSAWTRATAKFVPFVLIAAAGVESIRLRRMGSLNHAQWSLVTTGLGLLGLTWMLVSLQRVWRGRASLHDQLAGTRVARARDVRAISPQRGFAPRMESDR